jgi:hypothetical protein
MTKSWLDEATLLSPEIAFTGEQPVPENGSQVAHLRGSAITITIVDEHGFDVGRIR